MDVRDASKYRGIEVLGTTKVVGDIDFYIFGRAPYIVVHISDVSAPKFKNNVRVSVAVEGVYIDVNSFWIYDPQYSKWLKFTLCYEQNYD